MIVAMKDIKWKSFDNPESRLAWMDNSFVHGNTAAGSRLIKKPQSYETEGKQAGMHSIAKVKIVK